MFKNGIKLITEEKMENSKISINITGKLNEIILGADSSNNPPNYELSKEEKQRIEEIADWCFLDEYQNLSDIEIIKYKSMLILPNINFPHYKHLSIDDIIVYKYTGEKLLPNEYFEINKYFLKNYSIKIEISNYGRIKINDEFKIADVGDNVFKHGLVVYINGDWNKKSIHRLVKETFNPIRKMEKYEVHHLNNNGNDNRLENLIWVSEEDHRKIDSEFNIRLMEIAKKIYNDMPNFA